MKFKRIKTYIAFSLVLILAGCKTDPENTKVSEGKDNKNNTSENINLSFLLDLSDRISPGKYPNKSMEYYKRDVGYITAAAKAFDNHMRQKRMIQSNDKIQLFFDPEPSNSEINNIANGLKFHVNKDNISQGLLNDIKEKYSVLPIRIYELAIRDNEKSQTYDGSRTWSFFKNKLQDNCIEENQRNILIILTDGYLYHKDNLIKESNKTTYLTPEYIKTNGLNTSEWKEKMDRNGYGFLPAATDLSDIEILVLGINPSTNNPYELDIITRYWQNWFKAMNVKKFDIKTADLPSDVESVIQKFISS